MICLQRQGRDYLFAGLLLPLMAGRGVGDRGIGDVTFYPLVTLGCLCLLWIVESEQKSIRPVWLSAAFLALAA